MVNKITSPITPLGEIDKINEIIDELGNTNVDIDSKSITRNASNELQTVGIIDQNNTSTAIKTWTGPKAQYDAIVTKDNNTMYWVTDTKIIYLGNVAVGNFSNGRNVGEIVTSTIPLTDAGLHLLDGALIDGSGMYADFVTYIAGLVSTYPDLFETEANWQTAVATYGVCGKFVYDSTNNTVRLPKITGIVEGTTDLTALGDLVEESLPNITGNIKIASLVKRSSSTDLTEISKGGCFNNSYGANLKTGDVTTTSSTYFVEGQAIFNAQNSNATYQGNAPVQPQTIKVLYYIVIANSTKTEIEVDIDEIATDLNGKADVDLTNINASCKALDGQWVNSSTSMISSSTSIAAATTKNYSLSSYLPNDGYNYEVIVTAVGLTGSTSGNAAEIGIGSNIVDTTTNRVADVVTRTSSTAYWGWSGIIPIGTDRKIYIRQINSSAACTCSSFGCKAYRRIGTNS